MGGVDRFDKKRKCYSVSRRSRKWWLRIFYFLFDTAVVNAHALYNAVNLTDVLNQNAVPDSFTEVAAGHICVS